MEHFTLPDHFTYADVENVKNEEAGGGAEEAGSRTPSRPRISARGLGTQIPAAVAADRLA